MSCTFVPSSRLAVRWMLLSTEYSQAGFSPQSLACCLEGRYLGAFLAALHHSFTLFSGVGRCTLAYSLATSGAFTRNAWERLRRLSFEGRRSFGFLWPSAFHVRSCSRRGGDHPSTSIGGLSRADVEECGDAVGTCGVQRTD